MPEAHAAANFIRDELLKQSPRLMRHSFAEKSYQEQAQQELADSLRLGLRPAFHRNRCADEVWVKVDRDTPPWLREEQPVPEALQSPRKSLRSPRHRRRAACA